MPQSEIKKNSKKEKTAKQKPKAAGNLKKYFGDSFFSPYVEHFNQMKEKKKETQAKISKSR